MKFIEGVLFGGILATGAVMMYNNSSKSSKSMMKKGKQFARKIGII